jgi:type II restriction enzyme
MPTPYAEQAVIDALKTGKAIAKFISRNDVGETGGHQCGFYLPKNAWELFTKHPPTKGTNNKDIVAVTWQDGRVTDSAVTWYGQKTRNEYRLTRFGKDFPYLTSDNVGSLLVLIPEDYEHFYAYVLDFDDDIQAVQSALDLQILTTWGVYEKGKLPPIETEDQCIDRNFRSFIETLTEFPKSAEISEATREAVRNCVKEFLKHPIDSQLMTWIELEYQLFRLLERKVCQEQVTRLFKDIDDFLQTAASIMNRRKARAGRSLENHFEHLLSAASVPFDAQPQVDGRPDFLIPSASAYNDAQYPEERLIVLGVKTTCKDRWRQVLNEGKRVGKKHILTLQPGISRNQLFEMKEANVCLVVPQKLHAEYPTDTGIELLTVGQFIATTKDLLVEK